MKMKIEVVKPEYVFLKLTPNNSIRNNNTHLIARTISTLYRSVISSMKKEGWKYTFYRQGKFSYFIYLEKEKIEFYSIVPGEHVDVIMEKMKAVWDGVTIQEVDDIPEFQKDATKYQLVYEKEDPLSLRTNRSSNDLLNASLNVVELMEEGDRCGIFYNFIPIAQGSFKHSYKSTLEKIKKGMPTERNKMSAAYLLKMGISLIDTIITDLSEVLAGKNQKKAEEGILDAFIERLNGGKSVSESTKNKISGSILDTQILVFSESKTKIKERSYATSIAQSFEVIGGDNRLVKKKHNGVVNMLSTRLAGVEVNKMGDEESQNFISLAGRELIEKYKFMDKVETQETQLPKDLQKGTMCVGEVTYRGFKQKAYLSDDEQFKKLTLLLIGPSRAGKSNLIANLCIDAINAGECNIIFDFIKKCELSEDVVKCFPKEKVLRIVCDDESTLQGIGYNEVGISEDPKIQYRNTKSQTSNTLTLVNIINEGSGDSPRLTPKMERLLECACMVVYISGGSMKDVFEVLQDHELRHSYFKRVPKDQVKLNQYMNGMKELDEYDKDGVVVGTKFSKIEGIIDRLNALKRNPYMEEMLEIGTENNINLVEEMQKNQTITIQMPQAMFTTDAEKDVFTTYWISKIWLALQVRAHKYPEKKLRKVNLVIDEIYQIPHTEIFLKSKLSQIAKFGMKPIISCHYINQLRHIREELRSANTSYMLVAGCDKKNYDELKTELYPYDLDDLKNLKRYHSLNYIKTKDGYAAFITKLPERVDRRTARVLLQQKSGFRLIKENRLVNSEERRNMKHLPFKSVIGHNGMVKI